MEAFLVARRRGCCGGGGGVGGRAEGGAAGGGHGALELGDSGLDFWLEAVFVERALVVRERLHVVALLVAEAGQRGERAGVVGVDRQGVYQLLLGLLLLTSFF